MKYLQLNTPTYRIKSFNSLSHKLNFALKTNYNLTYKINYKLTAHAVLNNITSAIDMI